MASINTNIAAYYAQNNLRTASNNAQSSIARLSSGNAIVQASDDVSGLAIGTILKTDVSTLQTASTNASQATSLLQVANGGLTSLTDILTRQAALATQANSGTLSNTERGYLNQEFQQLTTEYNEIVGDTNFNGVNLLDGSISGSSALNGATSTAQVFAGLGSSNITAATIGTAYNNQVVGSQSGAIVTANDTLGDGTAVTFSVTLNGQTYTSAALDVHAAATHSIVLKNGTSVLTLTTTSQAVVGQTAATTLANGIQADLRSSTVYQTRAIDSLTADGTAAINSTTFNGTSLQTVTGASFVLKSNQFNANGTLAPAISSFAVSPYVSSTSTNGQISVNIGGDTYSLALTGSNTTSGHLTASTAYVLTDTSNSNNTFTFTTSALTLQPDVSTTNGAAELASTLNTGFGAGSNAGLNFQVGTSATDTIGITIGNLNAATVGTGSLDISTQADAQTAAAALTTAIGTITSATSNVGALEERFNYATDVLGTSIQNLDAARGQFLDTDVSSESTKFATEQVLEQAAISVLAQANQIPQNLLKLIG